MAPHLLLPRGQPTHPPCDPAEEGTGPLQLRPPRLRRHHRRRPLRGRRTDRGRHPREVHEELGLTDLAYTDLHPIGLRQTAVTLGADYLEREFQHWHLLPLDADLEAIPLADAEVSGLVEIDLANAIELAAGDRDHVPARYATRTEEGMRYQEATLDRTDLVPNYLKLDQLYLRLFIAARRYCDGERAHLFW